MRAPGRFARRLVEMRSLRGACRGGKFAILLLSGACSREPVAEVFEVRVGPNGVVESPSGQAGDREGRFSTRPDWLEGYQHLAATNWILAADARRWRETHPGEEREHRVRFEVADDQNLGELSDSLEAISVFGFEGPVDAEVVVDGKVLFTMRALHTGAGAHGSVDGFELILSTRLSPRAVGLPRVVDLIEDRMIRDITISEERESPGDLLGDRWMHFPDDDEAQDEDRDWGARLESLVTAGDPVLISLNGGRDVTVGEFSRVFGRWLPTPGWRVHVL